MPLMCTTKLNQKEHTLLVLNVRFLHTLHCTTVEHYYLKSTVCYIILLYSSCGLPCPKLVYRDRSGNGDNIVIISLSTDYGSDASILMDAYLIYNIFSNRMAP
jgi:hypothetical protein